MSSAKLDFATWNAAWRTFRHKASGERQCPECIHLRGIWRRIRRRPHAVLMQGSRYCWEVCLEHALADALDRVRSVPRRTVGFHRIPLGLLLLSRRQLTLEQLRTALESQRASGRGRIGEWLQALGYVSEQEITAALARQWSCPVLRANPPSPANLVSAKHVFANDVPASQVPASHVSNDVPRIPLALLESIVMIPVGYVQATSTLHIAFGERLDYSILYAIEQMTGCRTEPCMAPPSFVRNRLQTLSEVRTMTEVRFERVADDAEVSRIIRSYAICVAANEIRVAACGPRLWVRLLGRSRAPLDLLLQSPGQSFTALTPPSGLECTV
jgi:hypothetical protein